MDTSRSLEADDRESAEKAILRGLRYLELEAHLSELRRLAAVIRGALQRYDRKEERRNGSEAH